MSINKIVVSSKLTFGKQGFKYFISYRNNKEIRPLSIFFAEMSIYKRYSDKNKCLYSMIKDDNIFDKYMIILEKVSNIIKRLMVNLYIINFI